MSHQGITAEQAYAAIAGEHHSFPDRILPLAVNSPFVCPHCGVFADHMWGVVSLVTPYPTENSVMQSRSFFMATTGVLASAVCQSCGKEVIFFDGKVIVPATSSAPQPVDDMPTIVLPDFEEARSIVSQSPRGASALLRLVIQKLMPILGATKSKIDAAIAELVANNVIDTQLQQALDTVRVIGNDAVHPGELDLKDDAATAIMLFRLVNFIVERAITQPKEFAALYQGLPSAKLEGIANRDKPRP
jgi:predicted RNA-binding Zn-ribbon protein involved in translation (DUF1610 family)